MIDAIVVGAGHAGCEAALSLAHSGKETVLITLNMEHIAKMPCNPSIGGPAKGIVVREIDALGGVMPKVADETALQFKMLNTAKGPGVWSLRVQSDKLAYSQRMREICTHTEHLQVIEDIVDEVLVEDGRAAGVRLRREGVLHCKALILTTGTYMDSAVMISDHVTSSGPDGDPTSRDLSESLRKLGLKLLRLKTGTPQRILTSSIDFSKTKPEPGTPGFLAFSEETTHIRPYEEQLLCYLTYTTEKTHEIIRANLHRSSMYSGVVTGVGPRYCPSIEDKVVRFADKPRHQLFLEPQSLSLDTTYVQGFSTSMPEEVQEEMVHSLPGLENAVIKRYAYAIEYDAIDPLQVKPNLELKSIANLFIAGQILGTSGYEEAAGLGLLAGINCRLKLDGEEPLILRRDESYIGVMIDDLVTKGTQEPYRLLTSRAEYRLLLRHDNAEERLIGYGHRVGLISEERYARYLQKQKDYEELQERIQQQRLPESEEVNAYLQEHGYEAHQHSYDISELIKRPGLEAKKLLQTAGIEADEKNAQRLEIDLKYHGYIEKARKAADRMNRMENWKLPQDIDYLQVDNLRLEARQKLNKVKPATLGQAGRISGINPADLQVLAMYLRKNAFKEDSHGDQ
ncbi:MAG: tRNA uridine-5-carboxymethylaminomethyl(34) synthesis enzyme MnmG [Erysipelotrichaceae bacterium]|nr:tRNA uridine-5-carboxymethylaminomethyl(34) synthesis enzyme MnmG [Erysipelotrichaceae bacterium]